MCTLEDGHSWKHEAHLHLKAFGERRGRLPCMKGRYRPRDATSITSQSTSRHNTYLR